MAWDLELTSPLTTTDLAYRLAGTVNAPEAEEGASIRVFSLDAGWAEEVFLDPRGAFQLPLDLTPNDNQNYELSAVDAKGRVVWQSTICIRHRDQNEVADSTPCTLENLSDVPGLEPPWSICVQRIRNCLHLAATVAQRTGRKCEELLQYVHAQERYAEQAVKDRNAALYRECLDNLDKYAAYLEEMCRAADPQPLQMPPPVIEERELRTTIEQVRTELASVWKYARAKNRGDLELKLKEVAAQAQGLGQRSKADPVKAFEVANHLRAEIESIRKQLGEPDRPPIEQ
jgi:hypothetical protein